MDATFFQDIQKRNQYKELTSYFTVSLFWKFDLKTTSLNQTEILSF